MDIGIFYMIWFFILIFVIIFTISRNSLKGTIFGTTFVIIVFLVGIIFNHFFESGKGDYELIKTYEIVDIVNESDNIKEPYDVLLKDNGGNKKIISSKNLIYKIENKNKKEPYVEEIKYTFLFLHETNYVYYTN